MTWSKQTVIMLIMIVEFMLRVMLAYEWKNTNIFS